MLSLFRLNRLFFRPRLGEKPAGRRLLQLVVFFSVSLLFSFALLGGVPTAAIKVQEQVQATVELLERLSSDTNTTNVDDSTSTSHRVELVSYNKIQQLRLQKRISSYNQSQADLAIAIEKISTSRANESATDGNSSYIQNIERRIEQAGNKLWLESDRKLTGSAEIQIDLKFNGQLLNLQLLSSSGRLLVDQQLLASVRQAAPFPPVPQELRYAGEESIRLTRWLSFVIEKNGH